MVNLQECYEKFGGDYDGVMGRLRREQLVRKLLYKFLDDKNFELFEASMQRQEYDEALRAVHTLKGICQGKGLRCGSGTGAPAGRGLWPGDAGDCRIPEQRGGIAQWRAEKGRTTRRGF